MKNLISITPIGLHYYRLYLFRGCGRCYPPLFCFYKTIDYLQWKPDLNTRYSALPPKATWYTCFARKNCTQRPIPSCWRSGRTTLLWMQPGRNMLKRGRTKWSGKGYSDIASGCRDVWFHWIRVRGQPRTVPTTKTARTGSGTIPQDTVFKEECWNSADEFRQAIFACKTFEEVADILMPERKRAFGSALKNISCGQVFLCLPPCSFITWFGG